MTELPTLHMLCYLSVSLKIQDYISKVPIVMIRVLNPRILFYRGRKIIWSRRRKSLNIKEYTTTKPYLLYVQRTKSFSLRRNRREPFLSYYLCWTLLGKCSSSTLQKVITQSFDAWSWLTLKSQHVGHQGKYRGWKMKRQTLVV